MKRILSLAILAASAVSLVGCARESIVANPPRYKNNAEWVREEFEGHTYVIRFTGGGTPNIPLHDPDCKCGGSR